MKKERLRGMSDGGCSDVDREQNGCGRVCRLGRSLGLISEDNSDGRRMMHMDYKQRRGVSAQHAA
jgi:hypothetical protein